MDRGVTERIRRNIKKEEHAHAYYCRKPLVIQMNLSALRTGQTKTYPFPKTIFFSYPKRWQRCVLPSSKNRTLSLRFFLSCFGTQLTSKWSPPGNSLHLNVRTKVEWNEMIAYLVNIEYWILYRPCDDHHRRWSDCVDMLNAYAKTWCDCKHLLTFHGRCELVCTRS